MDLEPIAFEGFDRPGAVAEITLENFMCHSNMRMPFSPFVNFITGQNGSGKSAVLTALKVVFGASAKATDRGSSVKSFIKTGETYCKVCATLFNEGDDAYQHDLYGDRIILERQISASGASTFKLKNKDGRVVASKKDDVERVIDHFNVSVDNPCVVMGQDQARTILHSGSATQRYKFYQAATMLEQLMVDVAEAQQKSKVVRLHLDKVRDEKVAPLEEELRELQDQLRDAEETGKLKDLVWVLKQQLSWAYVYEKDKAVEETTAEIGKVEDAVLKTKEDVNRCKERLTAANSLVEERRATSTGGNGEVLEINSKNMELASRIKEAVKQRATVQLKVKAQGRKVEGNRNRHRLLVETMQKAREETQRETRDEMRPFEAQLAEKARDIEHAMALAERFNKQVEDLEAELGTRDEALNAARGEVDEAKTQLNSINGHIRRLEGGQQDRAAMFGERIPALLNELERNSQRFHRPPIGPLGMCITLTDTKWAKAVDEAIGKTLTNFIVHDLHDLQELQRLGRHMRVPINATQYNFDIPLHVPHDLPPPQYLSLNSVLQPSSHVISNVLMDVHRVEQTLLIETGEEGRSVAFSRTPNVRDVYDAEGYHHMRSGASNSSIRPQRDGRMPMLGTDVTQQLEAVTAQKQQVEGRVKAAEERHQHLVQERRGAKVHLEGAMREKTVLQRKLNTMLREEGALKREAEEAARKAELENNNAEIDIEGLEVEQKTLDDELLTLEQEGREMAEEVEKAQAQEDAIRQEQRDLKVRMEQLDEASHAMENQYQQALQEQDAAKKELAKMEQKTDSLEAAKARRLEALAALRKKREEVVSQAEEFVSEEEVLQLGPKETDPEELQLKIRKATKRIEREEARHKVPLDQLWDMVAKAERKYQKSRLKLENAERHWQKLKKLLKSRHDHYKRSASSLQKQLKWTFSEILRKKGFNGQCHVNDDEKTLSLEVTTADGSRQSVKDTRALSGGERSFSTLAFALSLHKLSEAPFRAMDEFDIFMDDITRRICLDTLVEIASEMPCQWIFITPHDISSVQAGPKVKIQQMHAPRP